MCAILHVHLLGDFRLVHGDAPIEGVTSARLQSFVAYLVIHRDSQVSRSQLAYTFWPDSSEAHAYLSLRKLLHTLRRALPGFGDLVKADAAAVQWRPDGPFTLDVAMFERALAEAEGAQAGGDAAGQVAALEEATDLYRGDLLPNCYDEWALPERERLREAFVSALERLIHLLSPGGDFGTVTAYAQRLLRYDPLREESYRLLMELYASAGDLAGATRTYKRCEATLRRELDVEPSQETQELYARLIESAPAAPTHVASRPNNLPAQTSTFIGREKQLVAASSLLRRPEVRLVTFTGPPGTGKTRLALQVGADLVNSFENGVFFVPLAGITESSLVIPTISQTLGVREASSKALIESLSDYLREKQILLLLDNFEQVAHAAPSLAELLAACPGLKMLVTSRAALHLRGEKEFTVPPLDLPGANSQETLEQLAQHEAVALFVERVVDSKPDFVLSRNNADAVVEICRQVEGLPLAIELAAARVKALTPGAIASRLGEQGGRLKLLVGGALDLPPRQQALRNAIAWSYDLLDPDEQALFRRLGVFAGGCSIEGAEAVSLPMGMDVVDGLGSLVDKNLLQHSEQPNGESRFWMPMILREFALEQLTRSGELEDAQARHARYYHSLVEEAANEMSGPGQRAWMEKLDVEHDDIRAVLQWGLGRGDADLAVSMSGVLWDYWFFRGYLTEGLRWLESALALSGPMPERVRARALNALAAAAYTQGDHDKARPLLNESLITWQALGDQRGLARTYNHLGAVAFYAKDYAGACRFYEQSIEASRAVGEQWRVGTTLSNLGLALTRLGEYEKARAVMTESVAVQRALGESEVAIVGLGILASIYLYYGDYDQARALYEEWLDHNREVGDRRNAIHALHGLGQTEEYRGNIREAQAYYREALALAREMDYRPMITRILVGYADLAARVSDWERCARLGGAVAAQLEAVTVNMGAEEVAAYERAMAEAEANMGQAEWLLAVAKGRRMTPAQAAGYALEES